MAEQFYTILTQVGKAKIANATALGTEVNFKEMAVGDGKGDYYNPTESQTELVNEVWRGQINHVEVDENNPNWIKISIVIPSTIGGFTIREAGIFDDEGNMIAVGKYPETYKPILDDGSSKDLLINMILEVSNTSSVTLKVDPTVILATKKDIQILSNDFNTFKQEVNTHLADMTQQIENIDLSADKIKIADKNNKFNSTEVEGALYECITKAEEAFIEADNGKKNWVDVIGSPLLNMDSFSTLKSKTQNLKNTFASNLNDKKVSASGTEGLSNLINKIKNIDTGFKIATGVIDGETNKMVQVDNLSFTPGCVVVFLDVGNSNLKGDYIFLFNSDCYIHQPDGTRFYSLSIESNYLINFNHYGIFKNGFETKTFRYCPYKWIAIG